MDFASMVEAASENFFLFELALLLAAAAIGGRLAAAIQMPEVLGQILVGILIGPTVLGWIDGEREFIHTIAEIGVVFLMFLAGLETDLSELKASGKGASYIALGGVLVPIVLGTLIPYFFFPHHLPEGDAHHKLMYSLYIGSILTATSVSITVSVLRDMGQLGSRQGVSILGAAIIDDVLGIILLAVVTGMVHPTGEFSIFGLIGRIILFFVLAIGVGMIISKVVTKYAQSMAWKDQITTVAIILCFILAFSSEMFKVAAITGAYIAGVIFAATPYRHRIVRKIQSLAYALFVPIFFVSIGLRAKIDSDIVQYLFYAFLIVVIAVSGKIIGCTLGAKLSGFTNKQCIQVGAGMIPRAEVALIVATQGINREIITHATFNSIVLLVVISTLITPPLLKILFKKDKPAECITDP